MEKLQANITDELDAKTLNEILANWIQQHIKKKKSYIVTKWDLSLRFKDGTTYANQLHNISH